MKKYKILFCSLDGTLIEPITNKLHPKGVWDMKLKFDVFNAINIMQPKNIFIISNQCVEPEKPMSFMYKLEYVGHALSDYCNMNYHLVQYDFYSPVLKDDFYKKPNTGMLQHAQKAFEFKCEDCLMIGSCVEGPYPDTDKKTAENFGIHYMDVDDFVDEVTFCNEL